MAESNIGKRLRAIAQRMEIESARQRAALDAIMLRVNQMADNYNQLVDEVVEAENREIDNNSN